MVLLPRAVSVTKYWHCVRTIGADITDYFNYGFTEDTWKQYCEKQRRLRMDLNMPKKTFVVSFKFILFAIYELQRVRYPLNK